MAYTPFNPAQPNAVTQNGTQFAAATREQLAAIRDMTFFGGDAGWTYAQSGGSASQPATMTFSKGSERIRYALTWGSAGGADGNVTTAVIAYSSDSGATYDTITTRNPTYDAAGNCTGGMPMLLMPALMGVSGRLKSIFATLGALGTTYALRSLMLNVGTGIIGGGNLTANRTLSFDQTWGDGRYALRSRTLTAGTGISGGGNLSEDIAFSFNQDWGDVRYALKSELPAAVVQTGPEVTHTPAGGSGSVSLNWASGVTQQLTVNAGSAPAIHTLTINPSFPADGTYYLRIINNFNFAPDKTLNIQLSGAGVRWLANAPFSVSGSKTARYLLSIRVVSGQVYVTYGSFG